MAGIGRYLKVGPAQITNAAACVPLAVSLTGIPWILRDKTTLEMAILLLVTSVLIHNGLPGFFTVQFAGLIHVLPEASRRLWRVR